MKVIERTLSILDLFLGDTNELSLDEIAEASGINKYTVRRMVSTLIKGGYLKQVKKRGKYSLGIKFLDFGGVFRINRIMVPIANPFLIELSEKVQESVQMAVWDGIRVFLCKAILTPHPLRVVPLEGTRLAMHATSLGKALIAEWPEEDLGGYFSNKLERYTPNTITDFNELKKQLSRIRKEGVAFEYEECYAGVSGVGAALKNGEGHVVGAFSLFGPITRLDKEKMKEDAHLVKECALRISRELGYQGSHPKHTDNISRSAVKKSRGGEQDAVQ
jgi:IclR family KDG regulon transcriptional repressor